MSEGSINIPPEEIKILNSEWGPDGLAGYLELRGTTYRFLAEKVLTQVELTAPGGRNLPQLLDSEGKVIPWVHTESVRQDQDTETTVFAKVEPGVYAIWSTEGGAASLKGVSVSQDGQVNMDAFYHVFGRSALLTAEDRKAMEHLPQAWLKLINRFITFGKRDPN